MTDTEATVRFAILDGISHAWGEKPEAMVDSVIQHLTAPGVIWAIRQYTATIPAGAPAADACPKCGGTDVRMRYCPKKGTTSLCWKSDYNNDGEHMHRDCQRCRYEWLEDCPGNKPSAAENAPGKIIRNDSTPETAAVWQAVDKAAERAPEAVKRRIEDAPVAGAVSDRCTECGNSGWVLDCNPTKTPVGLELLPCLIPDCTASGQPIDYLCVNYGKMYTAHRHPAEGYIMSLTPTAPVPAADAPHVAVNNDRVRVCPTCGAVGVGTPAVGAMKCPQCGSENVLKKRYDDLGESQQTAECRDCGATGEREWFVAIPVPAADAAKPGVADIIRISEDLGLYDDEGAATPGDVDRLKRIAEILVAADDRAVKRGVAANIRSELTPGEEHELWELAGCADFRRVQRLATQGGEDR